MTAETENEKTHISMTIGGRVETVEQREAFDREVSAAYSRLNAEALAGEYVIASTVQTSQGYVLQGVPFQTLTIVGHVIKRETIEKARREQMFMGNGFGKGGRN